MNDEIIENETILSIKDVVIKFTLRDRELNAIRGINLEVLKGESLAIVGESGSGKSVFTKSFLGLLDKNGWIDSGEILYKEKDIAKYKSEKEWINIRGKEIAMIFQDPMTALNPLKTIGKQIAEAVKIHQNLNGSKLKRKVIEILDDVGIDKAQMRYNQYPHEFSGGMRQRIIIAIAVACKPQILICDEPTTALDVTVQAQILNLLKDMQEKYDLTIIFITHDLGVVANIADRVAVMYAGDVIEIGKAHEIFHNAQHPYTWALLSSLPQLGNKGEELYSIAGTPPNLFEEIRGDAFAPRNPKALKIDFIHRPPFFQVSPTHKARTWLLDHRAQKIDTPDNIIKNRKGGNL